MILAATWRPCTVLVVDLKEPDHVKPTFAASRLSGLYLMERLQESCNSCVRHLQGKLIVIIGGSSGIGFAVAQSALEHGAKVIIASSTQTKVDAAVRRLEALEGVSSDSISGSAVDAKDENALEKFWDDVGKLDHMVWTAGDFSTSFADMDGGLIRHMFEVRFWASVFSAKYLAKNGLINPGGSMTLTSGANGEKPAPRGWFIGAAVAGAVNSVTRGLALAFAPIRVNCVSLGAFDTEFLNALKLTPAQRAAVTARASERTLVKRMGRPQEAAEAYLFCMKCSFYVGQVLTVEGGALLAQ